MDESDLVEPIGGDVDELIFEDYEEYDDEYFCEENDGANSTAISQQNEHVTSQTTMQMVSENLQTTHQDEVTSAMETQEEFVEEETEFTASDKIVEEERGEEVEEEHVEEDEDEDEESRERFNRTQVVERKPSALERLGPQTTAAGVSTNQNQVTPTMGQTVDGHHVKTAENKHIINQNINIFQRLIVLINIPPLKTFTDIKTFVRSKLHKHVKLQLIDGIYDGVCVVGISSHTAMPAVIRQLNTRRPDSQSMQARLMSFEDHIKYCELKRRFITKSNSEGMDCLDNRKWLLLFTNLSPSVSDKWLMDFIRKDCPGVLNVQKKQMMQCSFALVLMETKLEADTLLVKYSGKILLGQTLFITPYYKGFPDKVAVQNATAPRPQNVSQTNIVIQTTGPPPVAEVEVTPAPSKEKSRVYMYTHIIHTNEEFQAKTKGYLFRVHAANVTYETKYEEIVDLVQLKVGGLDMLYPFRNDQGNFNGSMLLEFRTEELARMFITKMNKFRLSNRTVYLKRDVNCDRDYKGSVMKSTLKRTPISIPVVTKPIDANLSSRLGPAPGSTEPTANPVVATEQPSDIQPTPNLLPIKQEDLSNVTQNVVPKVESYSGDDQLQASSSDTRPQDSSVVVKVEASESVSQSTLQTDTTVKEEPELYGLSLDYLNKLNICPPLVENIVLYNVEPNVPEADISDLFSAAGTVQLLRFDRASEQALVAMSDPLEAVEAISKFHNTICFERRLIVQLFHGKPEDFRVTSAPIRKENQEQSNGRVASTHGENGSEEDLKVNRIEENYNNGDLESLNLQSNPDLTESSKAETEAVLSVQSMPSGSATATPQATIDQNLTPDTSQSQEIAPSATVEGGQPAGSGVRGNDRGAAAGSGSYPIRDGVSTERVGSPALRGITSAVRGASPAVRGASPAVRGASPAVRGASPAVRGASPAVRGASPAVRGASPAGRGGAPLIERGAPTAGRGTLAARRGIISTGRGVPGAGRGSSAAGRGSPAVGRGSPNAGRGSPNAGRGAAPIVRGARSRGAPPAVRGAPPAGRGAPPAGRGAPPAGRGAPPARRGAPPAGRGAPPAGRGAPPAGRGAPPAGRGAPPAGRGAPPAGRGAPPAGRGAPPAGRGAPPAGRGAPPAGRGASPAGRGASPAGRGASPAGRGASPAGRGAPPAGRGAPPAGRGAPPAGRGAPPAGRGAPPTGRGAPPAGRRAPTAGRGAPPAGRKETSTDIGIPVYTGLSDSGVELSSRGDAAVSRGAGRGGASVGRGGASVDRSGVYAETQQNIQRIGDNTTMRSEMGNIHNRIGQVNETGNNSTDGLSKQIHTKSESINNFQNSNQLSKNSMEENIKLAMMPNPYLCGDSPKDSYSDNGYGDHKRPRNFNDDEPISNKRFKEDDQKFEKRDSYVGNVSPYVSQNQFKNDNMSGNRGRGSRRGNRGAQNQRHQNASFDPSQPPPTLLPPPIPPRLSSPNTTLPPPVIIGERPPNHNVPPPSLPNTSLLPPPLMSANLSRPLSNSVSTLLPPPSLTASLSVPPPIPPSLHIPPPKSIDNQRLNNNSKQRGRGGKWKRNQPHSSHNPYLLSSDSSDKWTMGGYGGASAQQQSGAEYGSTSMFAHGVASSRLILNNLPMKVDSAEIRRLCSSYGSIHGIDMEQRAFKCRVTFASVDQARNAARELNDRQFKGSTLRALVA